MQNPSYNEHQLGYRRNNSEFMASIFNLYETAYTVKHIHNVNFLLTY